MSNPGLQAYLTSPTLLQYQKKHELTEDETAFGSTLKKKQTVPEEENLTLTEILNSMFTPKKWEENGRQFIQYVSPEQATREKAKELFKALDEKMKERQGKEKGICPVREELYSQCFDEIIRQVTIDCPERGLLLLRVRDEIKMTIASYQILYESAILYGIRKQLQSESERDEIKKKLEESEKKQIELINKKMQLDLKLKAFEKHINERNAIEEERREQENKFLTQQIENLEKFLRTIDGTKP